MDDTNLESVKCCRDLGIYMDGKLGFSTHITEIVTRAKQRMSLLLRAFISKDTSFLVLAFKTYVLPLLDYCSQVWSPHLLKDVLYVESVQRLFTKRLPGLKDFSYFQRLTALGLCSLERRRLDFDLIFCYKILNGLIAGSPENYGLFLSNRRSRGHSCKLIIENSRVDVRKFYFANRVCKPWNALPEDLVSSISLSKFKSGLKQINLNAFLYLPLH